MYRNFFSLSELPFSISPNPKYLFMSDRHKEALAHLTYGLGETGGFALLTGEVGTGKTTISRCLLAQLPENTQTAFILNPTLSSQELLATICDELKIKYRKTNATLKYLTDKISEKLLKNHEKDINTLLIIDEAQHLQVEVLEQLRLLTNLETDTKKLLQVILIGQPELQQLLQRRDLRQLAQRITARYHLMPLTKHELVEYIKHRLFIADCHRNLFNSGALAKIHQLSKGIPRLTNLLCHSALMHAYNHNESIVNKKAVKKAAEQILGDELYTTNKTESNVFKISLVASIFSLVLVVALVGFSWNKEPNTELLTELTSTSESPPIVLEDNSTLVSKEIKEIAVVSTTQLEPQLTTSTTSEKKNKEQSFKALAPATTKNSQAKSIESIESEVNNKMLTLDDSIMREKESNQETEIEDSVNVKKLVEQKTADKKAIDKPTIDKATIDKATIEKKDIQLNQTSEVSPELLALFQAAMEETDEDTANYEGYTPPINELDDIYGQVKPLTQMSSRFQKELPSLHFSQHIYSSDGQGWVNVNGRDRYEGDSVAKGLILERILPQQVILSYQGKNFRLVALTHWKK